MDMLSLIDFRKMYKEVFEKRDSAKLVFMSAFVKSYSDAVQEEPEFNGFIDGKNIVYR